MLVHEIHFYPMASQSSVSFDAFLELKIIDVPAWFDTPCTVPDSVSIAFLSISPFSQPRFNTTMTDKEGRRRTFSLAVLISSFLCDRKWSFGNSFNFPSG